MFDPVAHYKKNLSQIEKGIYYNPTKHTIAFFISRKFIDKSIPIPLHLGDLKDIKYIVPNKITAFFYPFGCEKEKAKYLIKLKHRDVLLHDIDHDLVSIIGHIPQRLYRFLSETEEFDHVGVIRQLRFYKLSNSVNIQIELLPKLQPSFYEKTTWINRFSELNDD